MAHKNVDPEFRDAIARARAATLASDGEWRYYVHRAPGGPWQVSRMPVGHAESQLRLAA